MVLVEPPPPASTTPPVSHPVKLTPGHSGAAVPQATAAIVPPPLPMHGVPQAPPVSADFVPPPAALVSATAPAAPMNSGGDWKLFAGGIAVGVVIGAAIWLLVSMRNSGNESVTVATAEATTIAPTVPQTAEQHANQQDKQDAEQSQSVQVLKPVVEPVAVQPEVAEPDSPVTAAKSEVPTPVAPEPEPPASPARVPDESAVKADPSPSADEPVSEPIVNQPIAAPADVAATGEPVKPAVPQQPEATKPATTDPQLAPLNVRLPKVAFNKAPLRQFVTFAAEVSGSKIVIDYRSLNAAGFKAPTVTVRAEDCTLGQLLQQTLDKIGLSFEPRDGTIVIFAP